MFINDPFIKFLRKRVILDHSSTRRKLATLPAANQHWDTHTHNKSGRYIHNHAHNITHTYAYSITQNHTQSHSHTYRHKHHSVNISIRDHLRYLNLYNTPTPYPLFFRHKHTNSYKYICANTYMNIYVHIVIYTLIQIIFIIFGMIFNINN